MATLIAPAELVARIVIGYLLTGIVLSAIQLLLLQFLAPAITFFAVVLLGSLSAIVDAKWLPGIHSMILKQEIFAPEQQLSFGFSVAYTAVSFVLFSAVTFMAFRKKDIR